MRVPFHEEILQLKEFKVVNKRKIPLPSSIVVATGFENIVKERTKQYNNISICVKS